MKKHIPNTLTLLNALMGFVAINAIWVDSGTVLVLALVAAALMDSMDGNLARRFGVAGPLGVQLDSLSDLISFGVVPGLMFSKLLEQFVGLEFWLAVILGGTVTMAAVMRLATYNVATDQKTTFKGMPTPGNTLFVLGIYQYLTSWKGFEMWQNASETLQLLIQVGIVLALLVSALWQNAKFEMIGTKSSDLKGYNIAVGIIVIIFLALVPFVRPLALSIVVLLLPIVSSILISYNKNEIHS